MTMEFLVEKRQGIQQLRDEVEEIRMEVVELRSRSISPARSTPSMVVYDASSSLNPLRNIPYLNLPP
jgi:hypothetical protein